ncbi:hypothetical protein D9619_001770 [Psilocybe cf. subviscida]|uniref:DASH complex subunit DUO1 n=1 Tax=Psilocybe cf. subviscida TaxID=2480587 RepID=A0A8H5F445_9AGAR|nr:hypothetical protein D9619_001770 [Psilocybe cf. subviscida]
MDFPDSPDIPMHGHGSRLLSLESPLLPSDTSSSSRTGPGADDLSLSELSLAEHNTMLSKPFSLLARVEPDVKTPTRKPTAHSASSPEGSGEPPEGHVDHDEVDPDEARLQASAKRQEKLQSDIFVLKKLNAAFESFNDTLEATGTANERIAAQLEQTDALLNKYIKILSKSEAFSRLIFDEQWQGAEADEDELERQVQEAKEKARREEEERLLREQQEALRLENERQEALRREEKARTEREKSERAIRGGIRGVRGTRASMRGVRGTGTSRPVEPAATAPSRGIPRRATSTARPSNIGTLRGNTKPT